MHDLSTTVAAIATAPGRGGIGCVRLSGPDALRIAQRLCRGRRAGPVLPDSHPRFVTFVDGAGHAIDHGFVVAFASSRSYSGEPSVELWAHGSPAVLEALVAGAAAAGAEIAMPGEFTYRAVRHGRLDLVRAEAIRDLIAARTPYQARVAFAQLEGSAARRLAPLREALAELLARTEASIEFSEESDTRQDAERLAADLAAALSDVERLREDARRGRIVQQGARVALVGATSVGKSSLFNRLLGVDRAIVSEVPGTTRDTIEESLTMNGIPLTLVDTAGLRVPRGSIEAEGVRRARVAAGQADLLVAVIDASRMPEPDESEAIARLREGTRTIVVANKSDLHGPERQDPPWDEALPVSAMTGVGIDALRSAIQAALDGPAVGDDPVITDLRQAKALDDAAAALHRARDAAPLGDEIVVEELREALAALAAITGELANEDLYDRIFSTFCIGK